MEAYYGLQVDPSTSSDVSTIGPCSRFGLQTSQKRVLFDVGKDGAKLASKSVVPEDQQEPNESRRLWKSLTEAITNKDMDGATTSKTAVEEAQRENRRRLEEKGEKHMPRFFEEKNGSWVPKLEYVPATTSSF
jgi:hypothetical protein